MGSVYPLHFFRLFYLQNPFFFLLDLLIQVMLLLQLFHFSWLEHYILLLLLPLPQLYPNLSQQR